MFNTLQRADSIIKTFTTAVQIAAGTFGKTIPFELTGIVTEVADSSCKITYTKTNLEPVVTYRAYFSEFTGSKIDKRMKIKPVLNSVVGFIVFDALSDECFIIRYSEIELVSFDFNVQQLDGAYSMVNGEKILEDLNALKKTVNDLLKQLNAGIVVTGSATPAGVVSGLAILNPTILTVNDSTEEDILNKTFTHNKTK